jgi:hypothetical protein
MVATVSRGALRKRGRIPQERGRRRGDLHFADPVEAPAGGGNGALRCSF